jgi:ubiquinone biosynthesis protein UbiJ
MWQGLQSMVQGAVMERATLLANHVLSSEAAAMDRLRPHSGKTVQVEFGDWPALLPRLPVMAFRITPAGLVEWLGEEPLESPALHLDVDASNPALALVRAIGGARPKVRVTGSADFAADVDWLIENLRWDVQDDLARLVGQGPAEQVGRLARAAAAGVRAAVRRVGGLVGRGAAAPGAPGEPPRR